MEQAKYYAKVYLATFTGTIFVLLLLFGLYARLIANLVCSSVWTSWFCFNTLINILIYAAVLLGVYRYLYGLSLKYISRPTPKKAILEGKEVTIDK